MEVVSTLIGRLIKFFQEHRDNAQADNGGPQIRKDRASAADYKGSRHSNPVNRSFTYLIDATSSHNAKPPILGGFVVLHHWITEID